MVWIFQFALARSPLPVSLVFRLHLPIHSYLFCRGVGVVYSVDRECAAGFVSEWLLLCETKQKKKITKPIRWKLLFRGIKVTNEMCPAAKVKKTSKVVSPPIFVSSRPKEKKIKG